ncbi:hypothetical protein [Pontivivens ytuae]|uniref:Uncharacterized protein n=1 Tax=Pontivivens ytuae TaxID=2789856 RepID=A0A7S9LUQ5_9RHOB|nr:hypothetical protein [Pontivivens ytuae]QPH55604.1 hypothetical protein I0K15_07690 [Pontivivens ytuae]
MTSLTVFLGALLAASLEAIEALTVLLALALARSWRPVFWGAGIALVTLALAGVGMGAALLQIPKSLLQLGVGGLLALVAASWLVKSSQRLARKRRGRDQEQRFRRHQAKLANMGTASRIKTDAAADWIAGIAACKAVLLDGLEVTLIVLSLGGAEEPHAAVAGALVGTSTVFFAGILLRRPLTRLPEDAVMFWTAALLLAFAARWTAAGLGLSWPGDEVLVVASTLFFALAARSGATLRKDALADQEAHGHTEPNDKLETRHGGSGVRELAQAVAGKLLRLVWSDRLLALSLLSVLALVTVLQSITPDTSWLRDTFFLGLILVGWALVVLERAKH